MVSANFWILSSDFGSGFPKSSDFGSGFPKSVFIEVVQRVVLFSNLSVLSLTFALQKHCKDRGFEGFGGILLSENKKSKETKKGGWGCWAGQHFSFFS